MALIANPIEISDREALCQSHLTLHVRVHRTLRVRAGLILVALGAKLAGISLSCCDACEGIETRSRPRK